MIYSSDPTEEARMLAIRDAPNDRVRMMAVSRENCGRQMIMFDEIELLWIGEDRRDHNTFPLLTPVQYMAMIHTLASQLRSEIERNRKE